MKRGPSWILFSLAVALSAPAVQAANRCYALERFEAVVKELDEKLPLALPQLKKFFDEHEKTDIEDPSPFKPVIPMIVREIVGDLIPGASLAERAFMLLLSPTNAALRSSKDWVFIANPFVQISPEDYGISREELCYLHSQSQELKQRTWRAFDLVKVILKDLEAKGDDFRLNLSPVPQ